MKYNYQARNKDGQLQTGVVEASSKEAALGMLQNYGVFVTFLEEAHEAVYAKKIEFGKGVSTTELILFTRQLAILFKSSVPVVDAFNTLAAQAREGSFKRKIQEITEKIEGGTPLSQAIASYPSLFSPFFIGMIRSGEASGKLAEVLEYLADHMERENNFYMKILTAMIYPVVVGVVFVGVITLMIVFVIPQLSQVLKESGQELPWITRAVMSLSEFTVKHWQILAFIVVGLAIVLFRTVRSKDGKEFIDKNSLKVPQIGNFLKKMYLSQLAENLSTLIASGLPIIQALEITSGIIGSSVYKKSITEIQEAVKTGEPISSTTQKYPDLYPALFSQMILVGEKTGKLDSALLNIVGFFQKDVERTLDSLVALLEPVMIVGLGALVLGLMGSVLLPIYQMGVQ